MSSYPASYDQQVSQSGRRGPGGGWEYHPQSAPTSSAPASQSSQSAHSRSTAKQARPRCGQCGTRRFRRDPDTGLVFCREGHILQGYREEEAHDDQDYIALGQRRRVQRDRRKKKAKEPRPTWKGPRATFLGLECLQLVLRLQLKALRIEWPHLPPEIEPIARDLWTLYVSSFRELKATPYEENFEFIRERLRSAREESGSTRSRSRSRSRSRKLDAQEQLQDSQDDQRRRDEEEDADEESRLEAELRRLAADFGEGEGEAYGSRPSPGSPDLVEPSSPLSTSSTPSRIPRLRKNFSPMVTSVALLYLTLCTARIPVMWADLQNLLASGRMPYLTVLQLLPPAMTAKLPPSEVTRLQQDDVPSLQTLQGCTHQLADQLSRRFKVQFPELNAAPIMWRCVQSLALPPPCYQAAVSIINYLGVPLTAVGRRSISDPWSLFARPESEADDAMLSGRILPPLTARTSIARGVASPSRCAIMMAALLVVAKMHFGLDGRARSAESIAAKAIRAPPVNEWISALVTAEQARLRHPAFAFEMGLHPGSLSTDTIDALLDHSEETFFQRVHLNDPHARAKVNVRDVLPNLPDPVIPPMLPPFGHTGDARKRDGNSSLLSVQSELNERLHAQLYPILEDPPASDTTQDLQPGEDYPLYTKDALLDGTVHSAYQRLLSIAARTVGLTHGNGGGWIEMGELVSDLERLLLRRMREDHKAQGDAGRTMEPCASDAQSSDADSPWRPDRTATPDSI
ncbi:unnamed protein product [Parajaminaea phylloscopi]